MNQETGKRERDSLDARDGDDGGREKTPGSVKRAWSKPRVRLVVLSNTLTGTTRAIDINVEVGQYNPSAS